MKRATVFFLSVILLFSAISPSVSAAAATAANEPSGFVLRMEKLGGTIGNVLGHLLKIMTFTDESRIKKASPRDAAGQESSTPLFTGAAEQTLSAETWRAVELCFESGKTYADPFGDVTLDLLLYGNGRQYTIVRGRF